MPINLVTATKFSEELGYTDWIWIPLFTAESLGTARSISYAELPDDLVPASQFQALSETIHCDIVLPWGGFDDSFSEFVSNGGASGTVLGALNGLAVVEQSFQQQTTANYGFGQQYQGPEFGYCIGNLFKEKIYSSVNAQFSPEQGGVFVGESNEDIIWRSNFERFYISHGKISGFSTIDVNAGTYQITLSTNASTTSVKEVDFSNASDVITLYQSDTGESAAFTVNKVTGGTGTLLIEVQSEQTLETVFGFSDSFILSNTWIIQDPYLLDGVMNSIETVSIPTGNVEVFRTDQNQTHGTGSFTGAYIRKQVVTDEEGVSTEIVNMPSANTDILANDTFKWYFYPISSGSTDSEIYLDNTRYVVTLQIDEETGESQYVEVEMPIAAQEDYDELLNSTPLTYLRVEISSGGRSTRTNFHDSCLVDAHVIQENNFIPIIGQEGGNIIDVSITDLTSTVTFDPVGNADYNIFNQYSWKLNEWYMSNSRTRFFQGNIDTIDGNTIFVNVSGENSATWHQQSYFNHGTRDSISFYERFVQGYPNDFNSTPRKLYSKFDGWYTFSDDSTTSYAVEIVIQVTEPQNSGDDYIISLFFPEPPDNFTVGQLVYTGFDQQPYERVGGFNGQYNVEITELRAGTSLTADGGVQTDNTAFACMDGYWISPRFNTSIPNDTRFGLCGGRYWGLGENASDNDNAVVFMRTPTASFGIAATFSRLREEDWVIYYDLKSKILTMRKAQSIFRDAPVKRDLSIGRPTTIEDAAISSSATPSIELNTAQGRTSLISVKVPSDPGILLFTIGNTSDYYGYFIVNKGEMNLVPFSRAGIDQVAEDYTSGGDIVSPVVRDTNGQTVQVEMSVDTSDGPIYLQQIPADDSLGFVQPASTRNSFEDAQVLYINDNQTIKDASFLDMYEISDGEIIVVMGRQIPSFRVENEGVTQDSNSGSTAWTNTSGGVVITGTPNYGDLWGCPIRKDISGDNQYSLLVMNEVDFYTSIYNRLSDELCIFVRCYQNGEPYIGVYIIDVVKLVQETFLCTPEGDNQPFLWRPPLLTYEFLNDSTKNFADTQVVDNSSWDQIGAGDEFIRITSSNPNLNTDLVQVNVLPDGFINAYILDDGSYILLCDGLDGLHMIWSNNGGRRWSDSSIIVARDASSGLVLDGILIYRTEEGLQSKIVTDSLFNLAMTDSEGSSAEFIESLQERFDNLEVITLNTGPVPRQQLDGYTDDQGIMRVFYYDIDNKLCSVTGTALAWMFTDNF